MNGLFFNNFDPKDSLSLFFSGNLHSTLIITVILFDQYNLKLTLYINRNRYTVQIF